MDAAHWHLVLTHVPVVGVLFAALVLAVALVARADAVRRLALGLVVVVALTAVPTFLTGEPAEEVVERLPGVSERVIDRHEDAAQFALGAVAITGFLALLGLLVSLRAPRVLAGVVPGTLVVTLLSGALLAWTANLGGQIRHTEIRTSALADPGDAAAVPGTPDRERRTKGADEADD